MVTAPSGWPSNATHTFLRVGSDVMVWRPHDAPHAPPPPPPPPPQPYTTTASRPRRRHTSGSPIVEEPRLANMSYTACKAAATRESGTRRATQESRRERHSVSRPGSVTISFKNRCRLAVGMPFLQKFALIVWVRIPPGTLSETVEQTDPPQSHQAN